MTRVGLGYRARSRNLDHPIVRGRDGAYPRPKNGQTDRDLADAADSGSPERKC